MVRLTAYTIGYRVLVMLAMMYYREPYLKLRMWQKSGLEKVTQKKNYVLTDFRIVSEG